MIFQKKPTREELLKRAETEGWRFTGTVIACERTRAWVELDTRFFADDVVEVVGDGGMEFIPLNKVMIRHDGGRWVW